MHTVDCKQVEHHASQAGLMWPIIFVKQTHVFDEYLNNDYYHYIIFKHSQDVVNIKMDIE